MMQSFLTPEVLVAIAAVVVVAAILYVVSSRPTGIAIQRSGLNSARNEIRELLETINCGERLGCLLCCLVLL